MKKRNGRKILLKMVVPVVVRLDQALLPNQDNVVVQGSHLYWPFFYVHNCNAQYEKDHQRSYHETYSLYMTSLKKSSMSYYSQYLYPTKEYDLVE